MAKTGESAAVPVPTSKVSVSSTLPSAFSRAILLRAAPPTRLKFPPIRIFASGCNAQALTRPSLRLLAGVAGAKPRSDTPLGRSLAIARPNCPAMLRKSPPTRTLPSPACTATASTSGGPKEPPAPGPGLKFTGASTAPFAASRAMPPQAWPLTLSKRPPTTIYPSPWTAMLRT
jgi:hypothetical protein